MPPGYEDLGLDATRLRRFGPGRRAATLQAGLQGEGGRRVSNFFKRLMNLYHLVALHIFKSLLVLRFKLRRRLVRRQAEAGPLGAVLLAVCHWHLDYDWNES